MLTRHHWGWGRVGGAHTAPLGLGEGGGCSHGTTGAGGGWGVLTRHHWGWGRVGGAHTAPLGLGEGGGCSHTTPPGPPLKILGPIFSSAPSVQLMTAVACFVPASVRCFCLPHCVSMYSSYGSAVHKVEAGLEPPPCNSGWQLLGGGVFYREPKKLLRHL